MHKDRLGFQCRDENDELKERIADLERQLADARQEFAEECHRQSRLANKADLADTELQQFLGAAIASVEDWTVSGMEK